MFADLEANPLEVRQFKRLVYGEDKRVGEWMVERIGGQFRQDAKCIGLERDGELVAGCMVDACNGASCQMHVAGEGRNWLNRDFLFHCFHYVFDQLGCAVVIGQVADDNVAAQRFDEKLGFRLHTAIPDAHPSGALRIYVMRREDCRWLTLKEQHLG